MKRDLSRRNLFQAAGATAIAPAITALRPATMSAAPPPSQWPIVEGPNTPHIALGNGRDEASIRRVKQLGVTYVMGLGGVGQPAGQGQAQAAGRGQGGRGNQLPWLEADIRAAIARAKENGLTLYNTMLENSFPNTIYGRPGRDEEIDKIRQTIRAAGKAGLPVIEYNFYAHRAMEGYFEETGRAGLGHTGFDYEKMKGLPPLPEEGAHSLDEMWNNMTYFLKAVVPVAQESHVRLALHPNDPPAPISRGSWQIMGTVAGWKKLISIVDSPSNGITFDCGVTREMGEDPVEVCRYFASRDRINHMHYRNVRVIKPYERYTEVAIDEGQVDLFGVMKELVRNKYTRTIYPEHPRLFDYDREYAKLTTGGRVGGYPGGGGYTGNVFNVAYARAMMQAALESV
jgi:mannonate dehydratase